MAKILIVDDDPDICEAVELVLSREGHTVASANSRPAGMQKVTEFQPDLLILDVMMEESDDGFAMAQDLQRDGFNKPILMLTSVGQITGFSFDKNSEMVPVAAFHEKPIMPAALIASVNELLKGGEG